MNAPQGTGFVAGHAHRGRGEGFRALDPETGMPTGPEFTATTPAEVAEAATCAASAFAANRSLADRWQADLLRDIANRLDARSETILSTARSETGISEQRLAGELARTRNQLLGFAGVVESTTFGEPVLDPADPSATPPRPDLRRMLVPFGPVAVFGASNFPLAFSVGGGDTASALAAGCPVLVKAHPSHPGTSELVGAAITDAVAACGAHPGTFALVHGPGPDTGSALVTAPEVCVVGFTGSYAGGRALSELAATRPRPIPVFAEMGSLNPVFVTEAATQRRLDAIVDGFVGSMTLGAGQLCTKPGLVFTTNGREFATRVASSLDRSEPGVLLNRTTFDNFTAGARDQGAEVLTASRPQPGPGLHAAPVLALARLDDLRREPALLEEHFGPFAVVVDLDSDEEFREAARLLPGSLTATVHSEPEDHSWLPPLIGDLLEIAGRLVYNGFPTGVSVSGAQTHGGPFPASSDSAHTSVGWSALRRFQRPVTFQDVPDPLLPPALRTIR